MFYTRTADRYERTTNANNVTNYNGSPTASIACKVEPVQDLTATWLNWIPAYEVFQVFMDDQRPQVGEKLEIDWDTYVIKGRKLWTGALSSYVILYTQISQGT